MRHKGTISEWKERQGFGFITSDAGGERVFVHRSAFLPPRREPATGACVLYELAPHKSRRICASKVTFAIDATSARADLRRDGAIPWWAVVFLSLVAAITFKGYLPVAVLPAYLLASGISFTAYALDKSAARAGRWRTRESTLHLIDLCGGWPGGLFAQRYLRHKSKKSSFGAAFWLTVGLNCGALAWLMSPGGRAFLRQLL